MSLLFYKKIYNYFNKYIVFFPLLTITIISFSHIALSIFFAFVEETPNNCSTIFLFNSLFFFHKFIHFLVTLFFLKKNQSIMTGFLLSNYGAPEGIRTPDRRLRRALLYPTELLRHSNLYP